VTPSTKADLAAAAATPAAAQQPVKPAELPSYVKVMLAFDGKKAGPKAPRCCALVLCVRLHACLGCLSVLCKRVCGMYTASSPGRVSQSQCP
jgi:hypothetical protein